MFLSNSCSRNIYFEKNPKQVVVKTFENISAIGVHCWYITNAFAGFSQQIYEKVSIQKTF